MARQSKRINSLTSKINGKVVEPLKFEEGKYGLVDGLNFYSSNFDYSDSKTWALDWAGINLPEIYGKLVSAKDTDFKNIGFICRMLTKESWVADDHHNLRVINTLNAIAGAPKKIGPISVQKVNEKTPIIINQCLLSLDGAIDAAMRGKKEDIQLNSSKSELQELVAYCEARLTEMDECKDGYRVETIKTLKPVYRSAITSATQILGKLAQTKHKVVKPKKLNPAQNAKNVRFSRSNDVLGLKSVHPSDVVGKRKCYVYDSESRTLSLFIGTGQGLMFSGTTIKNFDPDKSTRKIIRKPEEFWGHFKGGIGMAELNKKYNEIRAKTLPVKTGRTNDHILFLKVAE